MRRTSFAAAILAIACLFTLTVAAQTTYYVATGGDDASNGLAWASAKVTIQAGIDAATDGDTVLVSNGTYNVTVQIDLTNSIVVRSVNGWRNTTVDAGWVNGRRVFYMTASNAAIDGLTITRGRAYTTPVANHGGGVYMTAGRVQNCVLTNNYAYSYGANIYMTAGTVSNCILTKGSAGYHGGCGVTLNGSGAVVEDCTIRDNRSVRAAGGVHILGGGGTVRHSAITENVAPSWSGGGAKVEGGGVLENCLIANNSGGVYPGGTGGGGVYLVNGTLRHCTIADNASRGTGGGVYGAAGSVIDTVVYNNIQTDTGNDEDLILVAATATYSCAPELVSGTGNITADPQFENAASDNYRLRPGSPCIDAGTNLAGVATDLDGNPRAQDGDDDGQATADMGAYEAAAATGGVFRCNFIAATNQADLSLNAPFTAYVYGPQTNGLYYWWDFTNDGSDDSEGADKRNVNHVYGPGSYSVLLTVSNDQGDVVSRLRTDYITVFAATTYVSTAGSDTSPYSTWASAADTIHEAVAAVMDGGEVYVSNGTYMVTEQVSVSKGITVRSMNGATQTVVQRLSGNTRLFGLGHADAVLDGFTLRNGSAPTTADQGGGVFMTDGTVRNCTFTNCAAVFGGGITMSGGLVTNCLFSKNPTKGGGGSSGRGGAINMSGGTVTHCTMTGNTSVRAGGAVRMTGGAIRNSTISGNTSGHGGGGVAMEAAGRLENCLITDNASGSYLGGGGGVYMNNAGCKVVNCTIADNRTAGTGGGIHRNTGVITNTIVYYNTLSATGADDDLDTGGSEATFVHCCSPDLTHDPGGSGNITTVPGFTDRPSDDYTLGAGSACIDSGTNVGNVAIDLAGTVRPQDGNGDSTAIHDIGAYEAPDAAAGPLEVNFSAPVQEAPLTLNAEFNVTATGSDTNNLYFWWDFDGDGTNDLVGYGHDSPTHFYNTPGFYTVSLTASNASGQTDMETKVEYIKVFAATTYAATNGGHVPAFDSWAKAATNLQDAVDAVMDGGSVYVRAGTYTLTAPVGLTKGVAMRSESGKAVTIVTRSTTTRLFNLSHSNAVLDGFTLDNGYETQGGGVFMSAGQVENCTVTNNRAVYGAGIYMTGGGVSNCLIVKNPTLGGGGGSGQGGGVYMTGGTVEFCDVIDCTSVRNGAGIRMAGGDVRNCTIRGGYSGHAGGGMWIDGASAKTVRNCLIIDNSGGDYAGGYGRGGGGMYLGAANCDVVNCTVAHNVTRTTASVGRGGGIYRASGTVKNTIVYYNSADADPNIYGAAGVDHSCSPELTPDPGGTGNITDVPMFTDTNTLNYVLHEDSPCIEGGDFQGWMSNAVDLAGTPRIKNDAVDMGAYETYVPPQGSMFVIR